MEKIAKLKEKGVDPKVLEKLEKYLELELQSLN